MMTSVGLSTVGKRKDGDEVAMEMRRKEIQRYPSERAVACEAADGAVAGDDEVEMK
jgi:hypothetical protein